MCILFLCEKSCCHTFTATSTWLSMYWTFADQHTFSSDKLVRYTIYSRLRQLKLSSVLSFFPTWTITTAYLLAAHSTSLTDCKKFRTLLHNLSASFQTDLVHPILQSLNWLPFRAWIQYTISKLCLSVITCTRTQYLSELSSCTLPLEVSVPPQTYSQNFLRLVSKHVRWDEYSAMSVFLVLQGTLMISVFSLMSAMCCILLHDF